MVFLAGGLAGLAIGLGVGALLQRRAGRSSLMEHRGFATAIAMLALLVSAVALANSDRRDRRPGQPVTAAPNASTTTNAAASTTAGTTTETPGPTGLISVPNVSHPPLARRDAVTILERAGLKVSIDSLPLSNVPAGFVISQNPLPAAMTPAGSTVTLVVSAAT